MKKVLKTIITIAIAWLVLWAVLKENYLAYWNSGELIGYNFMTIIMIAGIGYFVYKALKTKKQDTPKKP
jgi:hypothetical protein